MSGAPRYFDKLDAIPMTERRTFFLLNEGWIVLVVDNTEHVIPPRANGEPDHLAAQSKADGVSLGVSERHRQGAGPSVDAVARAESAC